MSPLGDLWCVNAALLPGLVLGLITIHTHTYSYLHTFHLPFPSPYFCDAVVSDVRGSASRARCPDNSSCHGEWTEDQPGAVVCPALWRPETQVRHAVHHRQGKPTITFIYSSCYSWRCHPCVVSLFQRLSKNCSWGRRGVLAREVYSFQGFP